MKIQKLDFDGLMVVFVIVIVMLLISLVIHVRPSTKFQPSSKEDYEIMTDGKQYVVIDHVSGYVSMPRNNYSEALDLKHVFEYGSPIDMDDCVRKGIGWTNAETNR